MIKFINISNADPFVRFKETYANAQNNNQKSIEATSVSSYCHDKKEVNSRFVNLKYVDGEDFIFFSNYNSKKAEEFNQHNQITALIYWNSINTQIRIKATIKQTSTKYNESHFKTRSLEKNALAISSDQSKVINSYEDVKKKFQKTLTKKNLNQCPIYWGGFAFRPYYFEFWKGHESRINKREVFEFTDNNWSRYILEP